MCTYYIAVKKFSLAWQKNFCKFYNLQWRVVHICTHYAFFKKVFIRARRPLWPNVILVVSLYFYLGYKGFRCEKLWQIMWKECEWEWIIMHESIGRRQSARAWIPNVTIGGAFPRCALWMQCAFTIIKHFTRIRKGTKFGPHIFTKAVNGLNIEPLRHAYGHVDMHLSCISLI